MKISQKLRVLVLAWIGFSRITNGSLLGLSDIKLLGKFTNLRELTLACMDCPLDAVPEWIKLMTKYGIINSNRKYLIDLSPLAKLPKLSKLDLSNTSFEDINTITGIKNLQELNISNTKVSDLKPIKKFKQLKYLDIGNCKNITNKQIEDLLKALPNLKIEELQKALPNLKAINDE